MGLDFGLLTPDYLLVNYPPLKGVGLSLTGAISLVETIGWLTTARTR